MGLEPGRGLYERGGGDRSCLAKRKLVDVRCIFMPGTPSTRTRTNMFLVLKASPAQRCAHLGSCLPRPPSVLERCGLDRRARSFIPALPFCVADAAAAACACAPLLLVLSLDFSLSAGPKPVLAGPEV